MSSLYGINPGNFKYDTDYINNCSKIELFIQISSYYNVYSMYEYYKKLENLYKNLNDTKLYNYFKKQKGIQLMVMGDVRNFEYTLDYCILKSNRFNTNVTYNPNGRVNISNEFKNWYTNWSLYMQTMDENTLECFRKCRYEGKNLDYFKLDKPITLAEITDIEKHTNSYKKIKSIKQKLA